MFRNRIYWVIREAFLELNSSRIYVMFMYFSLIVGVSAMIAVYTLGKGFEVSVMRQLESFNFGSNAFLVLAGGGKFFGPATTRSDTLTMDDVNLLRRLYFVRHADPFQRGFYSVSNGKDSRNTMLLGVSLDYVTVNNWPVSKGRFFNERDMKEKRKVCVVGQDIEKELYKGDALGKTIRIGGIDFEIVGVLEPKGAMGSFRLDDRVLVPITTANSRVFNRNNAYLDGVKVIFNDAIVSIDEIRAVVTKLLRERHKLQPGEPDDFRIITPEQIIAFRAAVSRLITTFLLVISLITLVVGGVIVTNVMYANIEDKTKTIAIRLAVGASPHDIMVHYIFVVVSVGMLSAFSGIILGLFLAFIIAKLMKLYFFVPWGFSLFVIFLALAMSLLFGILPSVRASKITPSELLR